MTDTITITGNIASVPEHRHTPSGVPVTTFRVASGQRRYDRVSGQWVDAGTNWYAVSTFRNLADHAFRSLNKGDRVVLTGRLRIRHWEASGKHGTAVEIDAEAVGHDLLWGTTIFTKDAPAAAPSEQWARSSESAEAAARGSATTEAAGGSGEWAVPGTGGAPSDDVASAIMAELADAGELVGADTPF